MAEHTSKQKVEQRAAEVAAPLIAAEGLELLDVEYVREHEGWVLRLFVDKPGAKVGIDECSLASRAVEKALEVEEVVPQEYNLEVSSPGLNRPLKKPTHFQNVIGKKIKIKTFGPVGEPPRKNFLGVLKSVNETSCSIEVEGAGTFTLEFSQIAKANLEFEFN